MQKNPHNTYSTSSITISDGIGLHLHRWQAAATFPKPLARIALVHGLAEHARRYDALALRLNAAGIELIAADLRGHGKSPGEHVWIESFDDYLLDTDALLDVADTTAPLNIPLFLMRHSMGGAIAALYAAERLPASGRKLAGLILSSAALETQAGRPDQPPDAALSRADHRSGHIVACTRRGRGEPARPMVHHRAIPARTTAQIVAAMRRIAAQRMSLPLFVFHGTQDALTNPDGSREFEANTGSMDSTLMMPGRQLSRDAQRPRRDHVIEALIDWTLVRAEPKRSRI